MLGILSLIFIRNQVSHGEDTLFYQLASALFYAEESITPRGRIEFFSSGLCCIVSYLRLPDNPSLSTLRCVILHQFVVAAVWLTSQDSSYTWQSHAHRVCVTSSGHLSKVGMPRIGTEWAWGRLLGPLPEEGEGDMFTSPPMLWSRVED